jgi:hypothetical protein
VSNITGKYLLSKKNFTIYQRETIYDNS